MDATQKITKNLGGDRLGSGNKNNISMHAYNRSTHDLSRAWRSSMMPGTLVPFMVEVGLPGDTWSINLETLVRTMPAIGPLYGSFKLQLDVFECPIRLYNGLLHNNMTKIGMNMAQVKLPKLSITSAVKNPKDYAFNFNQSQVASNALLNYLGISGFGGTWDPSHKYTEITRKFNAVPLLAYWDIYKNYYANKQEEKGVYIRPTLVNTITTYRDLTFLDGNGKPHTFLFNDPNNNLPNETPANNKYQGLEVPNQEGDTYIPIAATDYWVNYNGEMELHGDTTWIVLYDTEDEQYTEVRLERIFPHYRKVTAFNQIQLGQPDSTFQNPKKRIAGIDYTQSATEYQKNIQLKSFDLLNIDQMRIDILQATGLNNELDVANIDYEPYSVYSETNEISENLSKYKACGLGIKTYQSDLFNNWLQTEWIDGVNGINQITAIDTSSGTFTIDALNLANKVYNMLNRIAVSGGSYEDYIEAVYTTETARRAESPVYKGGMSAEIVFEEVVSTMTGDEQDALGTLAGKGTIAGKRGGNVEIKCSEPCFIMGIVSITPRVDYSQGNKWFMTELDTLDDLHKPALDGIGFEDLLQERMAFWGTYWDNINQKWIKAAAGKVPAWINYMTAVNETHGDFAEENKTMYMTLNRRYEIDNNTTTDRPRTIADLTTYINPTKYNYAFADTSLAAENFWVQIGIGCEVRRVMSAKVIPNL